MSFSNQNLVYVYYNGSLEKQLMGRLLLKNRQIFFEYDAAFIKTGLELSPFKLPLKAGVIGSNDRTLDDHSKNFSFLMNQQGNWTASPAYDLTFSSGPSGEHSTMIMGEGKNPTKKHLLKLAGTVGIKQDKTFEIIDQVLSATQKWDAFAGKVGVSAIQTKNIGEALRNIFRLF